MSQFISEDDLDTFEGWLRFRAIDFAALQPDQLAMCKADFEEASRKRHSTPKVGFIKFRAKESEFLYAVAVRDDLSLWLALWIRRSAKGDVYVFVPRADPKWHPHSTYHKDGRSHHKSHRQPFLKKRRQPPTDSFRGAEQIISQKGFGPKTVGAKFDPTCFTGVLEVKAGVLGPIHGYVSIDLVEPGYEPVPHFDDTEPMYQVIFKEAIPWLVVRVFAEQF